MARRALRAFHRYLADRFFAFGSVFRPLARTPERIMYHSPGNPAPYHVIRRQYLSYKTADLFPSAGKKSESNGVGDKQRLVPDNTRGRLTSKALENYMSQKKPYLDPDFKLTDMAEAMGVNRTVMSNFINQTYGKNFNCYLNLWRIEEYQILMAHPSNERKNPYQVMVMAGFKDSRHFQRAIRLEKAAKKQPDEKPQIKNKEG